VSEAPPPPSGPLASASPDQRRRLTYLLIGGALLIGLVGAVAGSVYERTQRRS
jgi:hypothetical protein